MTATSPLLRCRLKDVIWDSSRLFLVMEYMDLDFSEHMASQANHLSLDKIKVRAALQM